MEKRITSLLANNPGNDLTQRGRLLEDKIKWLSHNCRNMDNYLKLEPFSKDERLCQYICNTLDSHITGDFYYSLPNTGRAGGTEQHRHKDDVPELPAYCDALHWMRPGRQYLCNVYNTVCHAFHRLRLHPVKDSILLITEKELRHAERTLPELDRQTFIEMVRLKGYKVYDAKKLAQACGMECRSLFLTALLLRC